MGNRFQSFLDVGEWLNVVDLRSLDEGRDDAPGLAALVMAGEESILSVESNRADQIFDFVGVDFDPAVGEESLQAVPVPRDVGELFALGQHTLMKTRDFRIG